MNIDNEKYIKVFSEEDCDKLKNLGYEFMHESDGVYWFLNSEKISKFTESDVDSSKSRWVGL